MECAIVYALRPPRRLPRRLHRRQQQRNQDADDRDHDQEFHERETWLPSVSQHDNTSTKTCFDERLLNAVRLPNGERDAKASRNKLENAYLALGWANAHRSPFR